MSYTLIGKRLIWKENIFRLTNSKMTDRFERKASSSDLLSRLKARKVLGVGECSGTTTVSKASYFETIHCHKSPERSRA
ncbi:hypothetical protein FGIG_06858 [Fasciola gigantica]|uniref:Uncharacterized protein n=1 Tax=Fasciola gigantica TaxID=46835 RepID=A0A504Z784_FASGI|nr:hypothetical protein FGIG_06858 [Fasciola gigantica]